jgi:anti-sigma factor RsiW
MNNCDGIRTLAPLYLSGELEPGRRAAFESHIAKCPVCAAAIADDRNLDATLRCALGGILPDTSRLELALRGRILAYRNRRRQAWAGAIAATVALMAGLAWARSTKPPQWYADAAADHRTEVVDRQPRHWRVGDAEIAALVAQSGLELGQVKAFGAAGYRLERAKFCGIDGRRMLHLVFSNGTRTYSLFVSSHEGAQAKVRTVRRGAEQVAGFETGHFRGLVVSEASAAECGEMAQAAARRL